MLTGWKQEEHLWFLNEVSSVPLQQTLSNLQTAFSNFFGRREVPQLQEEAQQRICEVHQVRVQTQGRPGLPGQMLRASADSLESPPS